MRWADDATDDLDHILIYIDQFDSAAARRVVAAVVAATLRLRDFPRSGSPTHRRGVRKLSVPRWGYLIYYRFDTEIEILRVVHARRQRR